MGSGSSQALKRVALLPGQAGDGPERAGGQQNAGLVFQAFQQRDLGKDIAGAAVDPWR
jgi:hypothetical protein